ncbi:MAG: gamma-glutamyl-gamma-aminobutyrate hydrolase family protein [Alsobacter sp.]
MTIVLVSHETELPALDGMIAGEMAAERGARFTTLVGGGAGLSHFDCVQHVLEHGELAPNGVLWAERASGHAVGAPVDRGAVARSEADIVLVPINPAIRAHADAAGRIEATALAARRRVERYDVDERDGAFLVRPRGAADPIAAWRRDAFGRPVREGTPSPRGMGPSVTVLVIGDETLQRDVYPASVAALGDAAGASGIDVALRFINPVGMAGPSWAAILAEVDGVVLPGGSDMEQVPGQIDVARAAIRADVPTLGLCLGMQTMATAVAQESGGFNDANLAEADPSAQTKTFVRLHDARGLPEFRLGRRTCRVEPGSILADAVGGATHIDIRCNHRFVLNSALHGGLAAGGLRISGWQSDRDIADAVEMPGHRFFLGLQGHPELSSRRDRPHPVFSAFLRAAGRRHKAG